MDSAAEITFHMNVQLLKKVILITITVSTVKEKTRTLLVILLTGINALCTWICKRKLKNRFPITIKKTEYKLFVRSLLQNDVLECMVDAK